MFGSWMESEIRIQPEMLSANGPQYFADWKAMIQNRPIDMVMLIARGSSDNAALYARYLFEIHLGIPVTLAAPSVFTQYKKSLRCPHTLAIGISQSGSAPDVSEVLSCMKEQGHLALAITNTADSLITESADASLILNTEKETSVAATKTFTATMLALYELVRALGGDLENPAKYMPDHRWAEATRAAASEASGFLNRSNPIFTLSRGYGFAIAQESALKLMECALIPAKSYSTADFEHGPKALAGPGSLAVVYGEGGENLEKQGCQIIRAPAFNGPDAFAPIPEIFFGQWLALYAARSRNLDPDNPSFIHKVTETL